MCTKIQRWSIRRLGAKRRCPNETTMPCFFDSHGLQLALHVHQCLSYQRACQASFGLTWSRGPTAFKRRLLRLFLWFYCKGHPMRSCTRCTLPLCFLWFIELAHEFLVQAKWNTQLLFHRLKPKCKQWRNFSQNHLAPILLDPSTPTFQCNPHSYVPIMELFSKLAHYDASSSWIVSWGFIRNPIAPAAGDNACHTAPLVLALVQDVPCFWCTIFDTLQHVQHLYGGIVQGTSDSWVPNAISHMRLNRHVLLDDGVMVRSIASQSEILSKQHWKEWRAEHDPHAHPLINIIPWLMS